MAKVRKVSDCLLVLALLAGISLTLDRHSVGTAAAQEESWVLNPANGHYYQLTDPVPWVDAEAQAVTWGGHLVTLNSWEEEVWIKNTFGRREHFWIGFNDIAEEGTWVWSSGAPVTYTNWDTGEPNDADGHEDAAVMNWKHCVDGDCFGDYWNDVPVEGDNRGVVEKSIREIPVDIRPQSCPNPFNVKEKGVLPVAILGTEGFDVTQIDPATIRLEGVAPLTWALEDVTTPFEPYTGKEDAYDCNACGPDGDMDLTVKFKAQEVVYALGEVEDGDVLVLELTGKLQEDYGGTLLVGEDVVWIKEKQ